MGGCPYQIQSLTMCEVEWCGKESDVTACTNECKRARETLDVCVKKHVQHVFQKNGMAMDGTISFNNE